MIKTHFATTAFDDRGVHVVSACGRGTRKSVNTRQVDCRLCQDKEVYVRAQVAYLEELEAEFQAQTPRTIVPQFGRVNDQGVMECYKCSGVLFRERPRSLFSYHYVCESCGTSMHPMTETGMST